MKQKALILFDIDGTLVSSSGTGLVHWKKRMIRVFDAVFGRDISQMLHIEKINGKLERRYFRELADEAGVPREEFIRKFSQAAELFHTLLAETIDQKLVSYDPIPDAVQLVERLQKQTARMGLITGNIEKNAWLKLRGSVFEGVFAFGAFGDDTEDRGELVRTAHKKAEAHFNEQYLRTEVIVVGDTVHDIEAAKNAGVRSVGVATGVTDSLEQLVGAGADVAVTSLMDEQVTCLLGL